MTEDAIAVRFGGTAPHSPACVTVTEEFSGAEPWPFLHALQGRPRGFWAWDRGWIAHGGLLQSIELAPGTGPLDVRRFRRVQAAAGSVQDEAPESLRWYGGFAFGEDHAAEEAWAEFPAALFQRPEVELLHTGGETRLTVRGLPLRGETHDVSFRRLRRELEDWAAEATRAPEPQGLPLEWRENGDAPREAWEAMVVRALELFEDSALEKVVLARCVDIYTPEPADPVQVVRRLREQNPLARVFLFEPRPGAAFMGASPETLARLVHGTLDATAVAGSAPRGASDEESARLAEELRTSHKDLYEHRLVVDDMVERLRAWGGMVEVDGEPSVLALSRIQHLETRIRTRLPNGIGILDVLSDLHPTPAVCGRPRDAAFRFLAAEENFDRGWYGAPVGWFDNAGNGVFVPALRCALANGSAWRLFAGAGIVPESDPRQEWEETALKLLTARVALMGEPT